MVKLWKVRLCACFLLLFPLIVRTDDLKRFDLSTPPGMGNFLVHVDMRVQMWAESLQEMDATKLFVEYEVGKSLNDQRNDCLREVDYTREQISHARKTPTLLNQYFFSETIVELSHCIDKLMHRYIHPLGVHQNPDQKITLAWAKSLSPILASLRQIRLHYRTHLLRQLPACSD
ncbi:hypothetical protein LCGC14_1698370 [marine sediment metagenome]|uniref:Uncharacterized protein n=1 Tax=marine sediment metagenome TaxID=412755 RepID=A0A0F9HII8_9ZZZZ